MNGKVVTSYHGTHSEKIPVGQRKYLHYILFISLALLFIATASLFFYSDSGILLGPPQEISVSLDQPSYSLGDSVLGYAKIPSLPYDSTVTFIHGGSQWDVDSHTLLSDVSYTVELELVLEKEIVSSLPTDSLEPDVDIPEVKESDRSSQAEEDPSSETKDEVVVPEKETAEDSFEREETPSLDTKGESVVPEEKTDESLKESVGRTARSFDRDIAVSTKGFGEPLLSPSEEKSFQVKSLQFDSSRFVYEYEQTWESLADVQFVSATVNGKSVDADSFIIRKTEKTLYVAYVADTDVPLSFTFDGSSDLEVLVFDSSDALVLSTSSAISLEDEAPPSFENEVSLLSPVVFNGDPVSVLERKVGPLDRVRLPSQATDVSLEKEEVLLDSFEVFEQGTEKEIAVSLVEGETLDVRYTLPAPVFSTEDLGTKIIVRTSGSSYFENVPAAIPLTSVQAASVREVYWVEEEKSVDFRIEGNTLLFTAEHFSNQTYEIILISAAEHLDSNREFLSDIFVEVREQDDVWSEPISDGEYVRATFERALNDSNDITLYPRIVSGTPIVEVYEVDGIDLLATFDPLVENEYNQILLTSLVGVQDTFDLKVVGGSVEFDHIIDPTIQFSTDDLNALDSAVLDHDTFVLAWCEDDTFLGFSVYDTGGTVLVNRQSITVPGKCDGYDNQISVAALNTTSFVVAYQHDGDNRVEAYVYDRTGAMIRSFAPDADSGGRSSVSAAGLADGRAFIVAWQDDVAFPFARGTIYNVSSGSVINTVAGQGNGGDALSVSALNSTAFVFAYYTNTNVLNTRIFDLQGTALTGEIGFDANVDNSVKVVVSARNATAYTLTWHDRFTDEIIARDVDWVASPTTYQISDITDAKATTLDIAALNSTAYAVGWFNRTSGDTGNYIVSVYAIGGTQLINSYVVGTGTLNERARVIALSSLELGHPGTDMCARNFVVAWGLGGGNSASFGTYHPDGTLWDGDCYTLNYCTEIDQSGTYVLEKDIFLDTGSCFDITAHNVILDGSEYNLTWIGPHFANSGTRGVEAQGRNAITVRNFEGITNFYEGISFDSVDNAVIEHNTINNYGNYLANYGVYLFESDNALVYNNSFVEDFFYMIYIQGTYHTRVQENYFVDPINYGISSVQISSRYTFPFTESGNNTIFNNTFNGTGGNGVNIEGGSGGGNTLRYNKYHELTASAYYFQDGNNNVSDELLTRDTPALTPLIDISSPNNRFERITIDTPYTMNADDISVGDGFFGETNYFYDVTGLKRYSLLSGYLVVGSANRSEIRFGEAFVFTNGHNWSNDIQLGDTTAYVNDTSAFNVPANITFYDLHSKNFVNPVLLRDGQLCTNCYNFTPLTDDVVTFNVTGFSTYEIRDNVQYCGDVITESTTLQGNVKNSTGGDECGFQGLVIDADDVVLDCNGYNITGSRTTNSIGIFASGHTGVHIINCTIQEFYTGMGLSLNNSFLSYNSLLNNEITGTLLLGRSNVVTHNQFVNTSSVSQPTSRGVSLSGSNNTFSYNSYINNSGDSIGYGVHVLQDSHNNSFFGEYSFGHSTAGILFQGNPPTYSRNNSIVNSTFEQDFWGLYLYNGVLNSMVANNTFANNNIALYLVRSGYNQFVNNNLSSNQFGVSIASGYSNAFSGGSITDTLIRGIEVETTSISATGNSFTNISFAGGTGDDIVLEDNTNNTRLVNMHSIAGYDFSGSSVSIEDTRYGVIQFFNGLTGSGLDLNATIVLGNNSASVFNDSLNVIAPDTPANITLYGIGERGFTYPQIKRNGLVCEDCFNFTALNATNVSFNVSRWSTYFIGDDRFPDVAFIPPTPEEGQLVGTPHIALFTNDSEGRHYSLVDFNSDLQLWMRFEDETANCYQESANESRLVDGHCQLDHSGLYSFQGLWGNPENFDDGNYEEGSFSVSGTSYVYINYTKPQNLLRAFWRVADNKTSDVFEIPATCLAQNPTTLVLRASHSSTGNAVWACYKGGVPSYELITNDVGVDELFEEAMIWEIDNLVEDESTNGAHGELNSISLTQGYWGNAYDFDGESSSVILDNETYLFSNITDASVSFWVKPHGLVLGSNQTILDIDDGLLDQSRFRIALEPNDTNGYFISVGIRPRDEDNMTYYSTRENNTLISPDEWSWVYVQLHLYDQRVTVYINNETFNPQLTSGDFFQPTKPGLNASSPFRVTLGVDSDETTYFNGSLDDFMIFHRIIEIDKEMNPFFEANTEKSGYSQEYEVAAQENTFIGYVVDSVGHKNSTELRTSSSDPTNPIIRFLYPTPLDLSARKINYAIVNLSTTDASKHFSFVNFDNDLLLWLPLSKSYQTGSLLDLSDYGINGTRHNVEYLQTPHTFGGGADFSLPQAYVEMEAVEYWPEDNFTISLWLNYSGSASQPIFSWGVKNPVVYISDTGGNLELDWQNSGTSSLVVDTNSAKSRWHHLVLQRDDLDDIVVYWDGVLAGTLATDDVSFANKPLYLAYDGDSTYYTGMMDEFLIFNRTLNPEEIRSLHNASDVNTSVRTYANLKEGTHFFTAHAVDLPGNHYEHPGVEFTVDYEYPNISFVYPTPAHEEVIVDTSFTTNASIQDGSRTYAFVDFDDSVLLWYRFDNDTGVGENDTWIYDWSENEHNHSKEFHNNASDGAGSDFGLSGPIPEGAFGGSFAFDGDGDYINLGESAVINNEHVESRTISIWFNVDDKYSDAPQVIYEEGDENRGVSIYIYNGSLYAGAYNLVGGESAIWNDTMNYSSIGSGRWHNVIFVMDKATPQFLPNKMRIYVDGIQRKIAPGSSIWPHPGEIGIGYSTGNKYYHTGTDARSNYFKGKIDEILMFSRPISAIEAKDLYTLKKEVYPQPTTQTLTATHTDLLNGVYSVQAYVVDGAGHRNMTEQRNISVNLPGNDFVPLYDCSVLSTPNTRYILQNNIENVNIATCFIITAHNVTFDGNHLNLSSIASGDTTAIRSDLGSSGSLHGLFVVNVSLYNFRQGIQFGESASEYVTHSRIEGVHFETNGSSVPNIGYGFTVFGVNNSVFSNELLINQAANGKAGIVLDHCYDCDASYNNVTFNVSLVSNFGIRVDSSNASTVFSNRVVGAPLGTVFANSENGFVSNMFFANGTFGLYCGSCKNISVSQNSFTQYANSAILLTADSQHNTFHNNLFTQNLQSIDDQSGGSVLNYLSYSNLYGSIRWIDESFLSDLSFASDLGFGVNLTLIQGFAELNSEVFSDSLNSSANISFTGLPETEASVILRDGSVICDGSTVPRCYNYTALNISDVVFNVSSWTSYEVSDISSYPPFDPVVSLNSTDGSNMSNQDLNCFAVISDPNAEVMNVSVDWFRDGAFVFNSNYSENYASGSLFNAVLDWQNTTRDDEWSCRMRLFDGVGYSNWVFAQVNVTILNHIPELILLTPVSDSVLIDRTPTFTWDVFDADVGDSFNIQLNVTKYGNSLCDESVIPIVGPVYEYTLSAPLNCFNDGANGDYYNWTIRATDFHSLADWVPAHSFILQSYVSINLTTSDVNFGVLSPGQTVDTDNVLYDPFIIENDGNRDVNITVFNASDLWVSDPNPTVNYQIKADSAEPGSFNELLSMMSYFPLPPEEFFSEQHSVGGNGTHIIATLSYIDSSDTAEIDVNVTVPSNEPAGDRHTNITFLARLAGGDI